MGYDDCECLFCYCNGGGNARTDERASLCFVCLAQITDMTSSHRVASSFRSASIANCKCCGNSGITFEVTCHLIHLKYLKRNLPNWFKMLSASANMQPQSDSESESGSDPESAPESEPDDDSVS